MRVVRKSGSEGKSSNEDTESSDETESSESEENMPPPPVLKRQKGHYKEINEDKNERANEKMMKYLKAKTEPYFKLIYV